MDVTRDSTCMWHNPLFIRTCHPYCSSDIRRLKQAIDGRLGQEQHGTMAPLSLEPKTPRHGGKLESLWCAPTDPPAVVHSQLCTAALCRSSSNLLCRSTVSLQQWHTLMQCSLMRRMARSVQALSLPSRHSIHLAADQSFLMQGLETLSECMRYTWQQHAAMLSNVKVTSTAQCRL